MSTRCLCNFKITKTVVGKSTDAYKGTYMTLKLSRVLWVIDCYLRVTFLTDNCGSRPQGLKLQTAGTNMTITPVMRLYTVDNINFVILTSDNPFFFQVPNFQFVEVRIFT